MSWLAPRPLRALASQRFADDVFEGLSRPQKGVPSKYFYDAEGSRLFDDITRLPEYYLTRTEIRLLEGAAPEIAAFVGPAAQVVEYGAGFGEKAALLVAALDRAAGYVCVEIEAGAARAAAARVGQAAKIRSDYRVGDFTDLSRAGPLLPPGSKLGFFPGSTIGNFDLVEAGRVLRGMRVHLGSGARFVLGVDLVKPVDIVLPAYDDSAGVTAAFNKNVLIRINRELGADFDVDSFDHEARWNVPMARIEMHLVARKAMSVGILDRRFDFAEGETIHTESSYKYDFDRIRGLAYVSGWRVERIWTDPQNWVALAGLTAGAD
jgi:dimethylhistidine N-methyltransferase